MGREPHLFQQAPPELLIKIAELLPSPLSFRLTCEAFAKAGGSVLLRPDKLSRVYLHPTSISRFIDICGDETFASKIDTVVLLGEASYKGAASPNRLNDHPWPHVLEPLSGTPSLIELVRSEFTPFVRAYATLITPFTKLSNLRFITYATEARHAGLNITTKAEIIACTQANADYSSRFGRPSQPSVLYGQRMVRWSDLEVLVGLSAHAPSVLSLDIGFGMPSQPSLDGRFERQIPIFDSLARSQGTEGPVDFQSVRQKLRSLSYSVGSGKDYQESNDTAIELLSTCPGVENVTAYVNAEGKPIYSDIVREVLWTCKGLRLRKFRIVGSKSDGSGAAPCHLDIGKRTLLTLEGTETVVEDVRKFLLQHGSTLASICLDNVVLTEPYGTNVKAGMEEGLQLFRQYCPNLTEASVRLERAKFVETSSFKLSDIEELAQELGITETEEGAWNFGEYVMRKE